MDTASEYGLTLDKVVEALVQSVDPERIILFGSRARGDGTEDSDIDLLLEIRTGRDTRRTSRESYETIHKLPERPAVGIDIVVKDSAFVKRFANSAGTVVRPALREGKVLYAR